VFSRANTAHLIVFCCSYGCFLSSFFSFFCSFFFCSSFSVLLRLLLFFSDEFRRLGINSLVDTLRRDEDATLTAQLDRYVESQQEDLRAVEFQNLNMSDPIDIAKKLHDQTIGTQAFDAFLALLQHLLLIPASAEGRATFRQVEETAGLLVNGEQGELNYSDLKSALEHKISAEAADGSHSDVARLQQELLSLRSNAVEQQKQHEKHVLQLTKQHKLVKEQLEAEVQSLRGKLASGGVLEVSSSLLSCVFIRFPTV
jgi:Diaphanous FH3 Domain